LVFAVGTCVNCGPLGGAAPPAATNAAAASTAGNGKRALRFTKSSLFEWCRLTAALSARGAARG
jgi:hypothetical protein